MPRRASPEEKEMRRALLSHMNAMHGQFRVEQGSYLTLEELERIHEMMHGDQFACPPHKHKKPDDPYTLGEVKLKYPNYQAEVIEAIRGNF